MTNTNYNLSKRVNEFIDSLKMCPDTIEVTNIGNETIILYEDYEHPSIKNYQGKLTRLQQARIENPVDGRSVRSTREPLSDEHKRKISEACKNRVFSPMHRAKIAAKRNRNKNKDI